MKSVLSTWCPSHDSLLTFFCGVTLAASLQLLGSDVMRRIAAPMIGGIFTSFLMELLVYLVNYELWKGREVRREANVV